MVFIYTKKNKFACKGICVFYKNRIRVTKVQTTKEDDGFYIWHTKRKKKDDNTKLETLHAKKNQGKKNFSSFVYLSINFRY
jgi:hypothetical protein